MNRATCRGCGAPIVWIKTPAGKAMPCDPAPVYYKAAPGGKDKIVTTRGEVVSCEIVPGAEATDAGYRPHWATSITGKNNVRCVRQGKELPREAIAEIFEPDDEGGEQE